MDSVKREVNARVFGKGLELLSVNGGRFEIHLLLFADDTALVADSEEMLCRLVSEFGRVMRKKKVESECREEKSKRKWIVLYTWARKWQRMKVMKEMWYTE